MLSPRYELILLSKAIKHFGLTKAETKNVAAIKCLPRRIFQLNVLVLKHLGDLSFPGGFHTNSIVAHRLVLEKLAVTLGKQKVTELPHLKIPPLWLESNLGLPGIVQTPSVLPVHLNLQ